MVGLELQVYGAEALRVANASAARDQIRGNPSVAVTMIGERAADLIRHGGPRPKIASA
jgi:choline dehydrogenase-like flavoprotein